MLCRHVPAFFLLPLSDTPRPLFRRRDVSKGHKRWLKRTRFYPKVKLFAFTFRERRFTAQKHTYKYTFETSLQSFWDLSSQAIYLSILTGGCLKGTRGMTQKDPLLDNSLISCILHFERGDWQQENILTTKPSKPSCRAFEIFAAK